MRSSFLGRIYVGADSGCPAATRGGHVVGLNVHRLPSETYVSSTREASRSGRWKRDRVWVIAIRPA